MIDLGHLADPTDPDLLTLRSTMRRRSHTNRWQQRATMALLAAVPGICTAQEGEARAMTELEAVTVTGTRERAYRAVVAPTANKSDTALKETPFSIQTVTRELIEDRGVFTLGEAIRTVPGVTAQVGWGGSNDRFRLRGFATSANLKNGFRRSVFAALDEMANIEQIEVLKGPASALYGRFEPGGVVNIVTRKPLDKPQHSVELTGGSHDFRRATVDSTGPISDTLSYRITGSWQDNRSFRDFVDAQTLFVSPVLQWKLAPQTRLTAEFEFGRRRGAFDRGFGNSPLFLNVPIHYNYGERDALLDNDSALGSLVLDHRFDNGWMLHAGAMRSYARTDAVWYPYGFPAISGADGPDPQVNRRKQRNIDRQTDTTLMAEASRRFDTGGIGHRVLIGADYNWDEWDFSAQANLGPGGFPVNLPIDLHHPVHGASAGALLPYDGSRYASRNLGLYAQDELQFGPHWRLLLGLRYDRARTSARAQYLQAAGTLIRHDDALSPRVGLTWTPAEPVSLYASWARSFLTEPSGGMLRAGTLPAPSRGKQTEVGAKFSLLDGRLEPTVALFDIRRSNGVVSDPDDFNYVIQVGEQRSRGWEIDVPFSITPRWRVLASYTQYKAEIAADSNPALVGKLLANAPRRTASIWTTYDFAGAASGLSVGIGATYVGERQANTENTFALPSYTRWDANIAYRFGKARRYKVQLTVQNLGDRRYYDSGGAFVPTYPGAPRTVFASFGATL
ncbi:TonB-dependent siderophore receptor [Cupriavidus gilardii]|uniref:TonB-dependent siderophore receptor n=1 Tax=Cupriavidus gilardii TaxID=82541 RepID=UPI001C2E3574|nr:TonB-dependent siderophore receptor [Cupriavidus gilardii]MCT9070351.1 TonB-dependent siderophore receptor [Cupriavidus gilardii]